MTEETPFIEALEIADPAERAGFLDRNGVALIELDEPADIVFSGAQDVRPR